jgi:hypothetical protein
MLAMPCAVLLGAALLASLPACGVACGADRSGGDVARRVMAL